MTTPIRSNWPAGVLPSVPKYQFAKLLLKLAVNSTPDPTSVPEIASAIAFAYHVAGTGAFGKPRKRPLEPAEPSTFAPSTTQFAWILIGTGDEMCVAHTSSAAWKAAWAGAVNPLYVTWKVAVGPPDPR